QVSGVSQSFFFSSRRRHTSFSRDWSSDVCSSDLGNADGRHLRRLNLLLRQHLARQRQAVLPDFHGVVLDPAIIRVMLAKLLLCLCQRRAIGGKQDHPRTGGPLVKRKQVVGHVLSLDKSGNDKSAALWCRQG